MEEKPPETAPMVDPMPKNASVASPAGKAKKTALLSLFEMVGLSKLGEHLHEERESVKKVPLIILLCLVAGIWIRGFWDESKLESVKDDLVKSEGAKMEAERDRDKYQIEAQNAENALAPWKELANSQYPGEPINKSLDLLLKKVDSLQELMKDEPTKESVQRLSDIADAEKTYHDIAMMNMTGASQMSALSGISAGTAISSVLDGACVVNGQQTVYKTDAVAEGKFKAAIALEPKFPFSYIGLGQILRNRGDQIWKDQFEKAQAILEKTVQVAGHNPQHDSALDFVKQALNPMPFSLTPDTSTSQP